MYPAMHVRCALNAPLKISQLGGCIIVVRNGLLPAVFIQPDQCRGLIGPGCAFRPEPVFIVELREPDLVKSFYQVPELVYRDCRSLNALRRYVLLTLKLDSP